MNVHETPPLFLSPLFPLSLPIPLISPLLLQACSPQTKRSPTRPRTSSGSRLTYRPRSSASSAPMPSFLPLPLPLQSPSPPPMEHPEEVATTTRRIVEPSVTHSSRARTPQVGTPAMVEALEDLVVVATAPMPGTTIDDRESKGGRIFRSTVHCSLTINSATFASLPFISPQFVLCIIRTYNDATVTMGSPIKRIFYQQK